MTEEVLETQGGLLFVNTFPCQQVSMHEVKTSLNMVQRKSITISAGYKH